LLFSTFCVSAESREKKYTRMGDTGPNFGIFSRGRVYLRETATKKVDNKAFLSY
jgi:hypothetical protein